MVIRGRRVNRCDTCTRRKVKCDEGRPECERCKRSGLKCEGYSLNLVIVGPKEGLSSSPSKLTVWDAKRDITSAPRDRPLRPLQPRSQLKLEMKPKARIRCLLPKEDTIFKIHILSRFSPPSDMEPSAPAALLPQLISMDKSYSAQALSAVYFGKMRNQYQVYRKGTQLYVLALDQLRTAINDPVTAGRPETLTSVLCLCLYENIVLSETTAWLRHYSGVGRLVEHRGPECYQTEFEMGVYRICRFMIILAAGVTKSHCFLAQHCWISARKPPHREDQVAVDELYDIIARVPGLFHDMDNLDYADKVSQSDSYITLRGQTKRLLFELYDWLIIVSKANHGSEAKSSFEADIAETSERSHANMDLPPKTQAVAAARAVCYATILSLATVTDYFDLPLHIPSRSTIASRAWEDLSPCDPAHKAHVRKTLAVEIYHLATSTLRGGQSTSAAFFFIFSLQVAHAHLDPQSPEGMRLEWLLDSVICEKHGFETGRTRQWATFFNSPPTL